MKRAVAMSVAPLIAVVAVLGLTGCGADDPGRSTGRSADRRAGGTNVAMCIGDHPWDRLEGATVEYAQSNKVNGPGPFPLAGNWCDETNADFFYAGVYRDGAWLLSVGAKYFLGRSARITCDNETTKWVNLDVGETHIFTCNGITIEAVREKDVGGVPQIQFWIRTR